MTPPLLPPRVLVVDDHAIVREALCAAIAGEPDLSVCGTAASRAEALQEVEAGDPDVIVLDLMLGDSHDLFLAGRLATLGRERHVLVFSMCDENVYAERALRMGAKGYLMKTAPVTEVLEAIRTTIRGEVYLSPQMALRLLRSLTQHPRQHVGFQVDALTDQELTVFQLLGQGDSVEQIARTMSLSRKTVETYRRRVRKKLDLKSQAELLHHALRFSQGMNHASTMPA